MRSYETAVRCVWVAAAMAGWASGQTRIDLRTQGKDVDFSTAASTRPSKTGTLVPPTCAIGETFLKTDATPGKNLYVCTAPDVWAAQGGSGGINGVDKTVSNTYQAGAKQLFVPNPSTGGINIQPGGLPTNPAAGDLAMDAGDANKLKLFDGSAWNTVVAAANYVAAFTAQTMVSIPGSAHKFGSMGLIVECFDNSTPALKVEANNVSVDPVTFDVTVNFASPQTGRCAINGSSGGGGASTGAGAGMAVQLGDLNIVQATPTVLTVGTNCSAATPCNVRLGSNVYSVTSSSFLTATGGTGAVYLYIDQNGALIAGHNLTMTCSAACTAVSGVAAFPAGSIPLFTWTATAGRWDTNGGNDRRAFLSGRNISSGTGILTVDTGTQTLVAVDSATVPSYLAASNALNFPSIAAGACGEMTMALAGAAAGDSVAPGWPANLENGLIGNMRVSANNTVTVRVCNLSGTAVDPAAATFRATIVRSF
jgi:hypothetical protein